MGAGKLPEQINDRIQDALRDDGHRSDPLIEKLKSQPVDRIIEPEERNVRLPQTPSSRKGNASIAARLALSKKLQAIYAQIDTLKWADPKVFANSDFVAEKLGSLKQEAGRLRRKLAQRKSKNRSRR